MNTTNLSGPSSKINDPAGFGRVIFSSEVISMADYRIDCINKPDRTSAHKRLTHVGGPTDGSGRWKDTVGNVVRLIEAKTGRFYTSEGGSGRTIR